ncbi:phage terminase small subunit P27 family [Rhodococcus sp. IEGM 1401]|uniref:phage terminase small subunit P27 family n=1 Tax=unclassified Rhodococcus (in: high G+C Gram-positive bacteria) TaxID=192944 RepID=UPI0022B3DC67|nr:MULTISPECIES: phage terminase small subunit P27 family [unclassified Rhodococcus (in: high G+C Gram-positive bacteria)]MCZ4559892.1 phage terminase small subunit P27 family [Rhodococcus sp. IEGM 1401]MDI9920064.1 phage terminase small subunit P27 family [Rhodococcus sp. IEGM 1372]MDV8032473.1 phage terminase small subunit P27 family [Rhodococcus sp. IEGM 1414]
MPAPSKPAPLRLLNGRGDGLDSAGRTVVSVPSDRVPPTMPRGLPREARAEWARVVPLLDDLGVLAGELHRGVVIRYVRAWADYVELTADVAEHGRTAVAKVRDSAGNETTKRVVRPEVKMLTDTRSELHRLTTELGLSPATEAKAYASAQSNKAKETDGVPNPFAGGAS